MMMTPAPPVQQEEKLPLIEKIKIMFSKMLDAEDQSITVADDQNRTK